MADSGDWRLRKQTDYLLGVSVRRKRYKKFSAESDHDHCSFCWAKFMEEEDPHARADCLHEGYATLARPEWREDCHWICSTCFNDFKDQFKWQVTE